MEKISALLLSPARHGWKFLQVGYIPLYLRTHIQKTENNFSYTLTVTSRTGEELLRLEDTCEICNTTEAVEKLSDLRDRLCDRLEEKIAEKSAEPKPQPENPPKTEPKPPKIIAKLDTPRPFSLPPFSPAPPPVKLWTWMGTSAAAVALVTGIVLLAMDGDPSCDAPFPKQQCKERYATGAAGVTFLLTGIAGASLGGWKLYRMYFAPSSKVRVVPAAEPGKATLSVEWRF